MKDALEIVFAELEVGKLSIGYQKGELVFLVKEGLSVEESMSFMQSLMTPNGTVDSRKLLSMPFRVISSQELRAKKEK